MADPELDSGFVYDIYGDIHITRSQFFDVGFRFDDTIEDYLNRILPTLVDVIDDQFQTNFKTTIGSSKAIHPRHLRHRRSFRGSRPLVLLPSSWHRWVC
ncbi:hypothetical protein MA16_Dca016932 [Dendrobium catenatum]|uniref:Uncharacterized protein n=1 Tax=Dendrobium catenatum TaxID=906689 RepID=A0A2I0VWH4_9ASPA|nr:hypothetical protein MA16_Dca016932 [Dendrobium catenatum]